MPHKAPLLSWRKTMGWTISEAARQLGVARNTYKKWEADPDPPRSIRLAAAALKAGLEPS